MHGALGDGMSIPLCCSLFSDNKLPGQREQKQDQLNCSAGIQIAPKIGIALPKIGKRFLTPERFPAP
jgi:hypothetical protein